MRRLVLWDIVPKIDELLAGPVFEMGRRMIEGDWTTYWEGMLKMLDLSSEYAGVWAESISQDNYRRMYDSGVGVDVTPLLRSIRCEALVVGYAEGRYSPPSAARDVAAGIEGARFVQLGGSPYVPWHTETIDDVLEAVLPFLDEGALSDRAAPGFQTILFTDLEASTSLTQRLGDEGAQELLCGHNATVRGALEEHGGREVKHTGDGIMASFPSAVAAVTAALQIQRELAGGEVRVRVGLNAGEPIAEDDDLFGLSVIKAARVADRAEPGQVLVSRVVMDLCEGKTFQFSSLGEVSLKGFDQPVELFEIVSGR